MGAPFLDVIDWQRPWLAPLRAAAEPLLRADDWRLALNAAACARGLRNHCGLPVHFVPQAELPPGIAYETFISRTGAVPTRENLHDFFNALVWLSFPQIKIRLNALQAEEIARVAAQPIRAGSAGRGKLRDAATIFDENAALLVVRDAGLVDALRARRWGEVFIARRDAFDRDCDTWLFGHALLEKLVRPYKAITAHAWPLVAPNEYFKLSLVEKRAWLDLTVAQLLATDMAPSVFSPLPVLGVPGWWAENMHEEFYADASVFRPKRLAGGTER